MQSACAVLYCHLWPVALYNIFHTLSHIRHDFRGGGGEEKLLNASFFFIFSTFVWNIFHSKKN